MVEIDCGKHRLFSPLSRRCILKDGYRAKEMKQAGYELRRKGSCPGEAKISLNGTKMCTKGRRRRRRRYNNNNNNVCHENKELIQYLKRNRNRVQVVKRKRIIAQEKLIQKLKKNKTALKREVAQLKRKVDRSQNRVANLRSDINKQNRRIAVLVAAAAKRPYVR